MRRILLRKIISFGLSLGLLGTLLAYADSASNTSPAMLSADGLLTPRTRAVISGEYAYLLGTPQTVIADARVATMAVSPSGDAVLIAAYKRRPFRGIALSPAEVEPLESELNLVYWDPRTRTSKTLLREAVRENARVAVEQIAWLPQTRTALVILTRAVLREGKPETISRSLVQIETTAGTSRRIADFKAAINAPNRVSESLEVSPSQPLAYLLTDEDTKAKVGPAFQSSLRVYTPQGFRTPISLPDGVIGLTWMSDGRSLYSDRIFERNAEGRVKSRKVLTLVNLQTGEVTQPEKLPVIPAANKVRKSPAQHDFWAIDVATANAALQPPAGKTQSATTLWLRASAATPLKGIAPAITAMTAVTTENPVATDSLLIATNARLETQLATENTAAVLFTRDGSLCAAPIFRLPAQAFEDALRGIQRTATMTNAKQIGLGLMMYSQDYDENLPPGGAATADQIGPYIKNPSVFQNPGTGESGFVFSYQGPSAHGQIGQPATTQLGFVSGPGGRAIIWADGHVTWEDVP